MSAALGFAIPNVGTEVEVCMKNPLPLSARYSGMPDFFWYSGKILKQLSWVTSDMFCLSTDDKQSPVRVLDKDRVLDIRLVDGSSTERVEIKEKPSFSMWQVDGSRGQVYIVTLDDGKWTCDCVAGQFNRMCKHVKAVMEEIDK